MATKSSILRQLFTLYFNVKKYKYDHKLHRSHIHLNLYCTFANTRGYLYRHRDTPKNDTYKAKTTLLD